jgi:hypothetical protein
MVIAKDMFKTEGARAFYKGITPRVMRVGLLLELATNESPVGALQLTLEELIHGEGNSLTGSIKTRLQKTRAEPGQSAVSRIMVIAKDMFKTEGARAFYTSNLPPTKAQLEPSSLPLRNSYTVKVTA